MELRKLDRQGKLDDGQQVLFEKLESWLDWQFRSVTTECHLKHLCQLRRFTFTQVDGRFVRCRHDYCCRKQHENYPFDHWDFDSYPPKLVANLLLRKSSSLENVNNSLASAGGGSLLSDVEVALLQRK